MAKQLPKRDLENVGLGVTGACVALVTLVVAALIFMVAQKGLSAFVKDGVSVVEFFTGTKWDLANTAENGLPYTGALPLIVTSFAVMVLSTLIALPIAIGSAIFAVEIQPKFGSKVFQPLIELLTGIPSVVFGLIGFHVVVGLMKSVFHVSTGLGILPGAIVLAVMILPTMTTLSVDGLRAVPDSYRQGSLALGYTRWQTIWHVVLKSAMPSLMTAVILGMTRAFGETLAVRMVIGGIEAMPTSLLSPASTITTTLTTSMAVYAEGSAQDDVLWALGLLLMGMSLIFILIIHLIGRKGAKARGLHAYPHRRGEARACPKAGPLRHGRVDGDRRHRHAHRRLHGGLYPVRGHLDAVPAGLSHGAVARQRNAGRRALPAVRLVLPAADHPDHLGAHQPRRSGLPG